MEESKKTYRNRTFNKTSFAALTQMEGATFQKCTFHGIQFLPSIRHARFIEPTFKDRQSFLSFIKSVNVLPEKFWVQNSNRNIARSSTPYLKAFIEEWKKEKAVVSNPRDLLGIYVKATKPKASITNRIKGVFGKGEAKKDNPIANMLQDREGDKSSAGLQLIHDVITSKVENLQLYGCLYFMAITHNQRLDKEFVEFIARDLNVFKSLKEAVDSQPVDAKGAGLVKKLSSTTEAPPKLDRPESSSLILMTPPSSSAVRFSFVDGDKDRATEAKAENSAAVTPRSQI